MSIALKRGLRWRYPVAAIAVGCLVTGLGPVATAVATTGSGVGQVAAAPLKQKWGDDDTGEGEKASRQTGQWQADQDLGSMYSVTRYFGAQDAWRRTGPAGQEITGAGVTVAVIDTGVTPVPGLAIPGKVVNGPDLSFEGQDSGTRYLDGYGHGTHMAGIIAGRDAAVPQGGEKDAKHFVGVAPGARILNMKVATADGGADVTQVIAAVDWVVQHRNDNGMNVRVINLSYGTVSTQSYLVDPLAKAVENAWRAGIVVVVAAGNDGAASSSLTMPAADPYVIAVGASDHRGSETLKDDRVTEFTNPGNVLRRPDLLAPGKSVVSLRVPGSHVDIAHPEGLVTGDATNRFFRGSGTSQSAAVVSGAVALLLQARPTMAPDQVKRLLVNSAMPMPAETSPARGAGLLDIKRALEISTPSSLFARQYWLTSSGSGSLEATRGGSLVVDPVTGTQLVGEVDAQGAPFEGRRWAAASSSGTAWSGGLWNGRRWSGDTWASGGWSSAVWSGASWTGSDWQGRRWSSGSWTGSRWSAGDWSGRRWSSDNWEGRRWSGIDWNLSRVW